MPYPTLPNNADSSMRHRVSSALVAALAVACSTAFAALPAVAETGAPIVTAPTLAPTVAAVSDNSTATGPVASVAAPTAASSTQIDGPSNPPAASTQFIPYSMAAQAAARLEPADDAAVASVTAAPAVASALAAKPKAAASLSAYMAERWSIGRDQASRLVDMAHRIAAEHALDPLLLLAVAARESGFQYTGNAGSMDADPSAKKIDPGTAHGLMQVAGRFHPDKMPVDSRGRMRVTTDEENLNIGAQLLRENLSMDQGDVGRALQRYNGNLRDAGQRFARYVLKVRQDLQHVIRAE